MNIGVSVVRVPGSFGARLVACRRKVGMSQARLAELSGTTQAQISKYEKDATSPTLENLRSIARALSVNLDALVESGSPPMAEAFPRNPTEEEFVEAFIRRSSIAKEKKLALCFILRSKGGQWKAVELALKSLRATVLTANRRQKKATSG